MNTPTQSPAEASEVDWELISPVLNGAIASLGSADRHAILLRFFEGRSHAEIGTAMGTSQEAAKMRVSRSLSKLRQRLAAAGVKTALPALAATVGTKLCAPPSASAAAVAAGSGQTTAAVSTIAKGAVKMMKKIIVKQILAALAVVLVVIGGAVIAAVRAADKNGKTPQRAATLPMVVANAPSSPGRISILRFDAMIDDAAAAQLRGKGTAIKTSSQKYDGLTLDAGAVADAFSDFLRQNRVRWLSRKINTLDTAASTFPAHDPVGGIFRMDSVADIGTVVNNGWGTAVLETLRDKTSRLTLDYTLSTLFSTGGVFIEGKINYQAPVVAGKALVFIGPATPAPASHEVLVWIEADRPPATDATLVWLHDVGIKAAESPTRAFEPMQASFADGIRLDLNEITGKADSQGEVHWTADLRLRRVPADRRMDLWSALTRWDPETFGFAGLVLSREIEASASCDYPWFQKTATLHYGIAAGPWRTLGEISAAEIGNKKTFDSETPPVTVQLTGIKAYDQASRDGWKSDVGATTENAGDRFNFSLSILDSDGNETKRTNAQHDFGWRVDGTSWTTSFAVPPEKIAKVRVAVQPMEWAEFKDIPLVLPDDQVAQATAVPPNAPAVATPATAPASEHFAADSPEACDQAAGEAMARGDLNALRSYIYATTPLQKDAADVMYIDMISEIKLRQAADAVFDKAEVEQNHIGMAADLSVVQHYKVNGDIATPIVPANVIMAGPTQLRRVDGKWKLDMTVLGVDDPKQQAQIKQQLELGRHMAAVSDEIAGEIKSGKFQTVSEISHAIEKQMAAAATQP